MSTVPAVEIDGNDVTDEMQDKSLSIKLNAVDLTLVDPAVMPAISDVLTVDTPAWSGTVNSIDVVGYEGDVPFVKVRATNTDPLPDNGAGAFNLSDAGTPQGSPASFRDLSVNTQLQGTTTEVRAKATIFKEGLAAGDEIGLTSAVHGYTAETFTIMELTTDYPIDDAARYTLDLGLGDFTTATTGAGDGGPLGPIHLGRGNGGSGGGATGSTGEIGNIAESGDGGTMHTVIFEAEAGIDGTMGTFNLGFDIIRQASDPYDDLSMAIPDEMGLTLVSGYKITSPGGGTYTFWVQFVEAAGPGYIQLNHPMWNTTPKYDIPGTLFSAGVHFEFTISLLPGEWVSITQDNNAGTACISFLSCLVTRHGAYTQP